MLSLERPVADFLTKFNAKHPAISEGNLKRVFLETELPEADFVLKNRYGERSHGELLLNNENVRVTWMWLDGHRVQQGLDRFSVNGIGTIERQGSRHKLSCNDKIPYTS